MRYPPAYQRAIVESVKCGMSIGSAAKFYGHTPATILKWCKGEQLMSDESDESDDELLQRLERIEAKVDQIAQKMGA